MPDAISQGAARGIPDGPGPTKSPTTVPFAVLLVVEGRAFEVGRVNVTDPTGRLLVALLREIADEFERVEVTP